MIWEKIHEINLHYQNISSKLTQPEVKNNLQTNYANSKLFITSKVYKFKNMPEPRNATEGNFITYHY